MSATGTLTLYVDTVAVADADADAEIMTQPEMFSLVGDGLCVGRDSGSHPSTARRSPSSTTSVRCSPTSRAT